MVDNNNKKMAMPSAAKIIEEKNLNISDIEGTGVDGRVTKGDVLLHLTKSNVSKNSLIQNSNNENTKNNRKDDGMDILVPVLGESVVEATVSKWIKKQGDFVEVDDPIVELETDKVTLEVPASVSGIIDSVIVSEGDTVEVGAQLGIIVEGERKSEAPKVANTESSNKLEEEIAKPVKTRDTSKNINNEVISSKSHNESLEERVPMSRLRQAIARRLKEAQNTAAMLTTYNEVDMTALIEMRKNYQDSFEKKNGVRLGYMSFFVKASIDALRQFPAVNAEIDGNDIVYKNYYNIGVAVGTSQGLVVPVLKDADKMSFGDTELSIANFGKKAKDGSLGISDMAGGTFTISNGGVYGSLMSSPILNPPQSGILGMHKIEKRAVVIDDKIEIRPMMYLALSYDHRIIDGREAVSFLVRIKEIIEDPRRLVVGA
ncbi:2-oxoglutarate dehydrogenase complex dihydrolipoyllysine-residue succinyltransferase [Alphaproteobacteria bacterium]|nr:2-oxoglutarate dehydrogenase complex dihydrolipoyllysine-residue succinyltransferase [Alphaproteobacteria bacterium]